MTVPYRIVIGHSLSENDIIRISKTIQGVFEEIDTTLNRWNANSEVSKINRLKAHQSIQLSKTMQDFLERCAFFVHLSKGRFDPTVEPLQRYWKGCFECGIIPNNDVLEELSHSVGWNNIVLTSGTLQKKYDMTGFDFGGIAKGYTVDLLIQRIRALGFESLYVDWGGEIRTMALHPEGRPWRVFVRDPENPGPENALAIVSLYNESLATSGDYVQNWTLGNTTYTHVLDPETLNPQIVLQNSITSVSVKSNDCMTSDAIATILFLSKDPKSQGEEFLKYNLISECWIKMHNDKEVIHLS